MRFMDLDSSEWKECNNTTYEDLIEGLKKGGKSKEKAMNCLFEKLFHQVYQMQQKFGALTEDEILTAYSKAMINMMKAVIQDSFRGESAFTTWFYRIFYRRCVDILRKKTTKSNEANQHAPTDLETESAKDRLATGTNIEEVEIPEWKEFSDDSHNPEQLLLFLEKTEAESQSFQIIMNAIEAAMAKLTNNCQHLLQAYFEGYKMEDIAHMADLKNAHTARQSVFRCRNRLRKGILEELEPFVDTMGEKCQNLLRAYFGGQSVKKIASQKEVGELKIQRAISNCFMELKARMVG